MSSFMRNNWNLKVLVIVSLISLSISIPTLNRFRLNRSVRRLVKREDDPDLGIPKDWIEEEPINEGNQDSFPLPEGIPAEHEETKKPKTRNDSKSEVNIRNPNEKAVGNASKKGVDSGGDTGKGRVPSTDKSGAPKEAPVESSASDADRSKLVEICDKPVLINSANRFANSTVRLFRESNSWDLMGLPDKTGFTNEKMTVDRPMAPIKDYTSIVTILEGNEKLINRTFKFEKKYFWKWNDDGKQESGGKGGEFWSDLPEGGFDTMFHNGNSSKPMIIAFKGELVYYISTKEEELQFIDTDGKRGGKFKENFPVGLTEAFTWGTDTGVKVYLFRNEKYCFRDVGPLPSGNDCEEWRETAELFGCIKNTKDSSPPPQPQPQPQPQVQGQPQTQPPTDMSPTSVDSPSKASEDTIASVISPTNAGIRMTLNGFVSLLVFSLTFFSIIFNSFY